LFNILLFVEVRGCTLKASGYIIISSRWSREEWTFRNTNHFIIHHPYLAPSNSFQCQRSKV